MAMVTALVLRPSSQQKNGAPPWPVSSRLLATSDPDGVCTGTYKEWNWEIHRGD